MGTQRKKAEHVMFERHLERHTSSTKRLHNARGKTCGEDRATPFRDSDFAPSSQVALTKIDEKSFENHRKLNENR